MSGQHPERVCEVDTLRVGQSGRPGLDVDQSPRDDLRGVFGALMVPVDTVLLPHVKAASSEERGSGRLIDVLDRPHVSEFVEAGRIEQVLRAAGHTVRTQLRYVERAANTSEAMLILTFIVLLGVPVIAIGMITLVNTMTVNMLERTKEIGVLRSIGAQRHHLRSMMRAEGMTVAAIGWLFGIVLGFVLGRLLIWMISRSFDATFPVVFPLWSLMPVLILTLLVAALVVRLPLRRVVRLPTGDALRYE